MGARRRTPIRSIQNSIVDEHLLRCRLRTGLLKKQIAPGHLVLVVGALVIALWEGIALGPSLVMCAAHRLGIDVVRSAGMVGDDDDDVVAISA